MDPRTRALLEAPIAPTLLRLAAPNMLVLVAQDAALVYSNWVFAGAVLVWLFNSLAAVIRGTGNTYAKGQ